MKIFNDPDFKKKFWNWFDSLSTSERQKYQFYPLDLSELYFYNKVYEERIDS